MKKKVYDEASVIRSLNRKLVKIDTVNKVISVLRDATDVGNGSWGKIDYLCKVHGYIYVFVDKIINKAKVFNDTLSDNKPSKPSKAAKREAKLNMAANVKAVMKKNKK